MYISLFICLFLLVLSLICSKNNIFAPSVITSGIWFVVLFLNLIAGNKLNPLTSKFLDAINIWVILFCFSSLFMQALSVKKKNIDPSPLSRDILFYISIITFPFLLFKAYQIINLGVSSSWMTDLRTAAIGGIKGIDIEDTNPFYVVVWLVSYLIELFYYSKENKKRVFILFVMYFVFGFVTMAKIHFLILFISTVFVLYLRKAIKLSSIIIGFVLLLFVFQGIQVLRAKNGSRTGNFNSTVELYLLSPAPAFETIKPNTSKQYGENTFRFIYAVENKLGFSKVEPIDTILNFVYVGVGTNTYTVLYPFYKDFGLVGVSIFAIIIGLVFGFVYNKAEGGSILYVVIYAFLLYEIVMQYGAEMVFTNFSLNLKRIIIALIPFIISKYELFSFNRKMLRIERKEHNE